MADKKLHSVYITEELNNLIYYLLEREEITKIVFVKRAIRNFLAGDYKIDHRVLIRQKTHPDYISRNKLFVFHIEDDYKQLVTDFVQEYNQNHKIKCNWAQVFFQILLEYAAYLISQDSTGIVIKNN